MAGRYSSMFQLTGIADRARCRSSPKRFRRRARDSGELPREVGGLVHAARPRDAFDRHVLDEDVRRFQNQRPRRIGKSPGEDQSDGRAVAMAEHDGLCDAQFPEQLRQHHSHPRDACSPPAVSPRAALSCRTRSANRPVRRSRCVPPTAPENPANAQSIPGPRAASRSPARSPLLAESTASPAGGRRRSLFPSGSTARGSGVHLVGALLQQEPLDLSCRGFRKRVDKLNPTRIFVGSQPRLHKVLHRLTMPVPALAPGISTTNAIGFVRPLSS